MCQTITPEYYHWNGGWNWKRNWNDKEYQRLRLQNEQKEQKDYEHQCVYTCTCRNGCKRIENNNIMNTITNVPTNKNEILRNGIERVQGLVLGTGYRTIQGTGHVLGSTIQGSGLQGSGSVLRTIQGIELIPKRRLEETTKKAIEGQEQNIEIKRKREEIIQEKQKYEKKEIQLQLPSFLQLVNYLQESKLSSNEMMHYQQSQLYEKNHEHQEEYYYQHQPLPSSIVASSNESPLISNSPENSVSSQSLLNMSISPLPKLSSYLSSSISTTTTPAPALVSWCDNRTNNFQSYANDEYLNKEIQEQSTKSCLPSIHEMIYLKRKSTYIPMIKRKIMRTEKQLSFGKTDENSNEMRKRIVIATSSPTPSLTSKTMNDAIILKNKMNGKRNDTKTSTGTKCRFLNCMKKAKAGGFCICHGGGLRCSVEGCTKHAVTMGLCIRHGGGKRCIAEGCHNAARKNNVCWSHGGKKLCKKQGCPNGTKVAGYCWTHRYLRK